MKFWLKPEVLLSCAYLLLAISGRAVGMEPDVLGEARDLGGGEYLYSEQHFCDEQRQRCRVEYLDSDGQLIARKSIDFSANALAPALLFEDVRREREVRVDPDGGTELVVDGGFDNFIRARWDKLASGIPVTFPFLFVGREDPLSMRVAVEENAGCGPGQLCLEVLPDSWLLQVLVSPIRLTYDRETRRLLRFRGISNIASASGASLSVDIRYSYSS